MDPNLSPGKFSKFKPSANASWQMASPYGKISCSKSSLLQVDSCIKRRFRLQNSIHDVQELPHGAAECDHLALPSGFDSIAKGDYRRVVSLAAHRRHVQNLSKPAATNFGKSCLSAQCS